MTPRTSATTRASSSSSTYTIGDLTSSREQKYAFDRVFTFESIESIYESTAHALVEPLFRGLNACVFAYGPTGSGKTFTMLGSQSVKGLCYLSLQACLTGDIREEESPQ